MTESDDTYYRLPRLHRVFAAAAFLLLATVLVVIAVDQARPWKRLQREFHTVELRQLRAARAAESTSPEQAALLDRQIRQLEIRTGQGGLANWLGAALRRLPGLDVASAPEQIRQVTLPELARHTPFAQVPRQDRCLTCHLAADRPGFTTDAAGRPLPLLFQTHPLRTERAPGHRVPAHASVHGLFLDPAGPHPLNDFGCTVCHGGDGAATDFLAAAHTPDSLEQDADWTRRHGARTSDHAASSPMLPTRFAQAACVKCHISVTELPETDAPRLRAGFRQFARSGCAGCHRADDPGSPLAPLFDEPRVGPDLAHLAAKASRDWVASFLRDPQAFRPDCAMPAFYGLDNNQAPEDAPFVAAEIHAITHVLFARSQPVPSVAPLPTQGNPDRGRSLFLDRGCLACHQHRPYTADELPPALRARFQPGPPPESTFALDNLPDAIRPFARALHAPNLVNVAAKFPSREQAQAWLAQWIHDPATLDPASRMPAPGVDLQQAADIAAWLLSVPAGPAAAVDLPPVTDPAVARALERMAARAAQRAPTGRAAQTPAALDARLELVGTAAIRRLGCAGCHAIPGFDAATPVGGPLDRWADVSPTQLDFGRIDAYLRAAREGSQETPSGSIDGTDPFYQSEIARRTRVGYLFQKLHRPRSLDPAAAGAAVPWEDRLRMPRYAWAGDPATVESVMTFVLGLTAEAAHLPDRYQPLTHATPAALALARGERLLERHNCRACHILAMPGFLIPPQTPLREALPDLATNLEVAYDNRANDFPELLPPSQTPGTQAAYHDPRIRQFLLAEDLEPDNPPDPASTLVLPETPRTTPLAIAGQVVRTQADEDDAGNVVTLASIQLWQPVTVRGFTFQVGDTLTVRLDRVTAIPAAGGDLAWLLAALKSSRPETLDVTLWNRLPPPLVREGLRVQPAWLASYLRQPTPLRPASLLAMPRYHFATDADPGLLADHFAARDHAAGPFPAIPQRDPAYLAAREREVPGYLDAGWRLIAQGLCLQCHAAGPYRPTGADPTQLEGPRLDAAASRYRPEFLLHWLAMPSRLVPFTAMPATIPPQPPPGGYPTAVPPALRAPDDAPLEEKHALQLRQLTAIRDRLQNGLPQSLAPPTPAGNPPTPTPPPSPSP